MNARSRLLSPSMAVPRLRILYFAALTLLACLLVMLRVTLAAERRLSTDLIATTRTEFATPRLIVVRMPPSLHAAGNEKSNVRRSPAARKEK